jgi:uncharacterized protein (TIGR03435 family)
MQDAYVVTAPEAKAPSAKQRPQDDDISFSDSYSVEFQVAHPHGEVPEVPKAVALADVRGIAVGGTMEKFCQALEASVDRPVVNESGLEGEFAFNVKASQGNENDFLERLRSQLGIVITPARREVAVVVLKAR